MRQAVSQWRFQPAENWHQEVSRNAEGGVESHTTREKAETYFDLSFTFSAAGTVLTEPRGKY